MLYRHELQRKLIHLSSLWIPAVIFYCPRPIAIAIFALCVVGMLTGEYLRTRDFAISRLLRRLFVPILRAHEQRPGLHLCGASYTVIAALLATLLFPQEVAVTVLTIMLVSDAVAALVGLPWGRHRLLDKSLEGSAAFFVSALACVFVLNTIFMHPAQYIQAGIAAAVVATVTELFSSRLHVDDNLSIPAFSGLAMWLFLL